MAPVVTVNTGQLRGRVEEGIAVFCGIPYATPPVGKLRWQPPAPALPWTGARDAFEFGNAAPQMGMEGAGVDDAMARMMAITEPQSEDCLYLNLWTPSVEGERPVMVWIHGGGFAAGSSGQRLYLGQELSRRDVVVVTINYRLGPFGVLHLDRPTGGAIAATGNEALLDQVQALWWVRDNIQQFGGNPDNVTIFGESTGSACVTTLMAMPSAKGLFHKAIAHSGGGNLGLSVDETVDWFTQPMLRRLATQDPQALMEMPAKALLQAYPSLMNAMAPEEGQPPPPPMGRYPGQVVDGVVLPVPAEVAIAAGSATGVPYLSGNTSDEMSMFAGSMGALTLADLTTMLAANLPPELDAQTLINTYTAARQARGAPTDAISLAVAMAEDRYELVPVSRLLDAQRQHAPVYRYRFDWRSPVNDWQLGAFHGLDIGFVFGTYKLDGMGEIFGQGPAADALSAAMMDAWVAFARAGDPSSSGLGDWPQYDAKNRSTMMIGGNVHIANDPRGIERAAWDAVSTSSPALKRIL